MERTIENANRILRLLYAPVYNRARVARGTRASSFLVATSRVMESNSIEEDANRERERERGGREREREKERERERESA